MIVITGASDGLGLELAKLYSQTGMKVVNISRRACDYADRNIITDLQKESDIQKAAETIQQEKEPLEILVNCAGVLSFQEFGRLTADEMQRVITTNSTAPALLISQLLDKIKKDGSDVVNVASTASLHGSTKTPVYNMSKWALRGLSQSIKEELKETPCRVINFCPDVFSSGLFEKATGEHVEDRSKWMRAEDLALLLKQLLDLPKLMEVSEIVISRNKPSVLAKER